VADEGKARTRARTWPVLGPRPAWGAAWPRAEFAVPARLREWAMAEAGAGRLLPWFAVAFGAGIVLYFTAEHEPVLWAASAAAGAGIVAVVLLRRRPIAFVPALGLLAVCAGSAVATIKAALIAHPVLRYPAYSVSLAGFVTLREESQKSDRFVMRVERIEGAASSRRPSVCACRYAAAWRRPRARSSRSRPSLNRRCSRCGRAATISPATFISTVSFRAKSKAYVPDFDLSFFGCSGFVRSRKCTAARAFSR
jgi:hypothetical protein